MPHHDIIRRLAVEITGDPMRRGYSGLLDQQLTDNLNAVNLDTWVDITSSQVFEAIDPAEFLALTSVGRARIDRLLSLGTGIKTAPGTAARIELVAVFGAGSVTIGNLASVAKKQVSRAMQIGMPEIRVGWIALARA